MCFFTQIIFKIKCHIHTRTVPVPFTTLTPNPYAEVSCFSICGKIAKLGYFIAHSI